MSRFDSGRFSDGRFNKGRFSGRRSGPYITLAIGETLPALLAVEAGDTYAMAVPSDELDPDLFRVVGDDTDEVIEVVLEWRKLGSEDWQSATEAFFLVSTQNEGAVIFITPDLITTPGAAELTADVPAELVTASDATTVTLDL